MTINRYERDQMRNRLATATPFGRLSGVEQDVALDWLEANGWLKQGKCFEPAPQPQKPFAHKPDGSPVYRRV